MAKIWLLKGKYEAEGWKNLEQDSKTGITNVIHFDRLGWALVEDDEKPDQYEGLEPMDPPTGVYVNPNGIPIYLIDGKEVLDPKEVVASLGSEAEELLDKLGDADTVLERLGRAY
jgi:hypothetical protein